MLHRDLDAHAYKKRRRHTPRSTLTLASDYAFWSYSKPEGARTMCRGVLGPAEQDRQERLGMLLYLEFSILSNYPNRLPCHPHSRGAGRVDPSVSLSVAALGRTGLRGRCTVPYAVNPENLIRDHRFESNEYHAVHEHVRSGFRQGPGWVLQIRV